MYKYFSVPAHSQTGKEFFCVDPAKLDFFHDLHPEAVSCTRKEAVKGVRAERKARTAISRYYTPVHVMPFPGAWYDPAYGYLYAEHDGVIYPVVK